MDRYQAVGDSVTSPRELTRRKEIFIPLARTNYTLFYHYGDLDETPVRGVSYLATFFNGEQKSGWLDDQGKAALGGVPKGPVSIVYQHDSSANDDSYIVQARAEIHDALQAIVVQTKADMALEWQEWNDAGWLRRQYLLKINEWQGQAVGAWSWLEGTVEAAWQLAVLLYKTDREIREIQRLFVLGQWKELDQKINNYRAKGEKVLAAGSELKELLILIFHDESTRNLILDFPAKWWAAIPPDEQAELKSSVGTQIAIDLVISVILAAFTAGAGAATYGSAKWGERIGKLGSKLVKLLDRLKEAFSRLAVALKGRKRKALSIDVHADNMKVIETTWKPSVAVSPVLEEFALINGKKVFPHRYERLFHGTNKSTLGYAESTPIEEVAADIYKKGLPSRGGNLDLAEHAAGASDRAFRGTTTMLQTPDRQAGAVLWADDGGVVIRLENVKGYDVNELLEGRVRNPDGTFGGNKVHGEQEIAVAGEIKAENINMIYAVKKDRFGRLIHQEIPR